MRRPPLEETFVEESALDKSASLPTGRKLKFSLTWARWFTDLANNPTYAGTTTQVSAAPYPGAITTRGIGPVYQNTTGKPMYVRVVVASSAAFSLHMYSDSYNPPTTEIDATTQNAGWHASVGGWVLPNNYYKVFGDAGAITFQFWTETY